MSTPLTYFAAILTPKDGGKKFTDVVSSKEIDAPNVKGIDKRFTLQHSYNIDVISEAFATFEEANKSAKKIKL